MSNKRVLTTDEQVRQLNDLAREMAVWEDALHPSVWAEQLEPSASETRDMPPVQLKLGLE